MKIYEVGITRYSKYSGKPCAELKYTVVVDDGSDVDFQCILSQTANEDTIVSYRIDGGVIKYA